MNHTKTLSLLTLGAVLTLGGLTSCGSSSSAQIIDEPTDTGEIQDSPTTYAGQSNARVVLELLFPAEWIDVDGNGQFSTGNDSCYAAYTTQAMGQFDTSASLCCPSGFSFVGIGANGGALCLEDKT